MPIYGGITQFEANVHLISLLKTHLFQAFALVLNVPTLQALIDVNCTIVSKQFRYSVTDTQLNRDPNPPSAISANVN